MAQLWGGRFTKETDQLVYNFNASISFDQKFYKEDIEGSIAHVTMLGKQGIISQAESNDIVACLKQILKLIISLLHCLSGEKTHVKSYLVVSASACVKLLSCVTKPVYECCLNEAVDILIL